MFDGAGADWAPLNEIRFTGKEGLEQIDDWALLGQKTAGNSADILNQTLNRIYEAIVKTSWMGGATAENKAKARRLLRPLGWTAAHALPAAQRRFAQLPSRLKHIYAVELQLDGSDAKGIAPPGRR